VHYGREPAGTDMVISSISYSLPSGVENLALASGAGNINGTGNALDNVIIGNQGNNVLNGKGGNDTLTGGGGADTSVFQPGFGHSTVTDFGPGQDILQVAIAVRGVRYFAVHGRELCTDWAKSH